MFYQLLMIDQISATHFTSEEMTRIYKSTYYTIPVSTESRGKLLGYIADQRLIEKSREDYKKAEKLLKESTETFESLLGSLRYFAELYHKPIRRCEFEQKLTVSNSVIVSAMRFVYNYSGVSDEFEKELIRSVEFFNKLNVPYVHSSSALSTVLADFKHYVEMALIKYKVLKIHKKGFQMLIEENEVLSNHESNIQKLFSSLTEEIMLKN